MKQIAYFHLPGIFEFTQFYDDFLWLYTNEKDKFNDWAVIDSIYGNPQDCIWGGGREPVMSTSAWQNVFALMEKYPDISIGLTFSNLLVEEKHLQDEVCNNLCRMFQDSKNYAIVNSEILTGYLLENYPSFKLISSTTKCLTDDTQVYREINDSRYELVCLDYNYNNRFDVLNEIESKGKCELLVNPICIPNCPSRHEHYLYISRTYLHRLEATEPTVFYCPYCDKYIPFYKAQKRPTFISVDDIHDKYLPLGFTHYKIEGRRAHSDDLTEILLYYLVKPKYQLEIRERLYGL